MALKIINSLKLNNEILRKKNLTANVCLLSLCVLNMQTKIGLDF